MAEPGTPIYCSVRSGIHGLVAAKKTSLLHGNKAKRANGANRIWGAQKWQPVLWTDESKVKYLAVADGSLFVIGQESAAIIFSSLKLLHSIIYKDHAIIIVFVGGA